MVKWLATSVPIVGLDRVTLYPLTFLCYAWRTFLISLNKSLLREFGNLWRYSEGAWNLSPVLCGRSYSFWPNFVTTSQNDERMPWYFLWHLGTTSSFPKSRVHCSKNVSYNNSKALASICGSPITNNLGNYLGVPLIHGCITMVTYKDIIENTQKRLAY